MAPLVVVEQRLGAALAFVIAGARPADADEPAIVLDLRMHIGIAVDLAGRVEACRIGMPSRLAMPSMLIAPSTLVFVVCTGSRW
jgi:hypothetical protein